MTHDTSAVRFDGALFLYIDISPHLKLAILLRRRLLRHAYPLALPLAPLPAVLAGCRRRHAIMPLCFIFI